MISPSKDWEVELNWGGPCYVQVLLYHLACYGLRSLSLKKVLFIWLRPAAKTQFQHRARHLEFFISLVHTLCLECDEGAGERVKIIPVTTWARSPEQRWSLASLKYLFLLQQIRSFPGRSVSSARENPGGWSRSRGTGPATGGPWRHWRWTWPRCAGSWWCWTPGWSWLARGLVRSENKWRKYLEV